MLALIVFDVHCVLTGHYSTLLLVKEQSRLYVGKFSFSQKTINVWNNVSTDCVHASSVLK